jgi:hypothetical protein
MGLYTENVARLIGKRRSAFLFVQRRCPRGGGTRSRCVASGIKDRRQGQACIAVIDQGIGALGKANRRLGGTSGLVVVVTARQQLCPQRAPRNRCLQRVTGKTLTLGA